MPPIKNTSPKAKGRTIVYGLARTTQGQIREAGRLWLEYKRTGKQKHRIAYDKHVAAMLADRPNLTREDRIKRLAWAEVERLAKEVDPKGGRVAHLVGGREAKAN
jgi:hypothetical protein